MSKRKKIGTCTYCGENQELTKDHVPPKNLFAKPRPNNLLTIPCCYKCNGHASKDDEYFRLNVVLRQENEGLEEANSLYESILRSLNRKEAIGMRQDWENRQTVKEVVTPSGIFSGLKHTYDVDLSRLDKVVKRTVKGIIFGEKHERLPDSYDINVFSTAGLHNLKLETKQTLKSKIKKLLEEPYIHIGNPSIFSFWRAYESGTYSSLWLLVFFKKTSFIATVTPKQI